MLSRFRRLWVAPAMALTLSGCGLRDQVRNFFIGEDHGTTAVELGDRKYSKADLERFFDNRLSEFRDPADADMVKSNLLDAFVEEKLLLYEADRMRVEPGPEVLRAMLEKISSAAGEESGGSAGPGREPELEKSVTESMRIQKYLQDFVLKDVSVTEQECDDHYRSNLGDFIRNDVVHVREILVDDLEQAERVQASLKEHRNRNFGDLARMYSKAPSASSGGDLGTFQRGELPDEFERAVFSMAPGTASRIIRTKYGYHTFLVEERIPAHQQKFYQVRDQIREKLLLERQRVALAGELDRLIRSVPVEIHWENLDFQYTGTRFSSLGGHGR